MCNFKEVTLNYDTIEGILATAGVFSGATVGRFVFWAVFTHSYANRIAKGQFTLDGVSYQMCINNGPNSLHGGNVSWGHVQFIHSPDIRKSGLLKK